MIVLPDRRLLILTPPHTVSRSLHYGLCGQLPGAIWRDGPSPDGTTVDHHTSTIGAEHTHFTRVLVVRNPFTRILGLWSHLVDWCRYNGDGCCGFGEFVQWVHDDRADLLSYMYRYTICRWLGDVQPAVVVRYESLTADMESLLGRKIELAATPTAERKPVAAYYTHD